MRVFAFLLAILASQVFAQSYPSKPIRLLVPFAPGGSSTLVARFMSEEMAKGLGTSFIIENKPGGGGNIAMQEVARAAPDGYTLIIGHVGSLAMNPYMYERLPYDVDKDFAPVSLLAVVPNIFVVYHEVPAKDLREFVALAKAKPGQINYGSAGNGSAGHLAMEYLKQVSGMEIQHVPYKGTGPNVTDLIAGRTQATSAGTPPLLPHVKSGKLRVIAVGTSKRLDSLPEVGTVAEQGYPGRRAHPSRSCAGSPKKRPRRRRARWCSSASSPTTRRRSVRRRRNTRRSSRRSRSAGARSSVRRT